MKSRHILLSLAQSILTLCRMVKQKQEIQVDCALCKSLFPILILLYFIIENNLLFEQNPNLT